MTDKEFVYELTKPIEKCFLLPYLEHEERIHILSQEPQFKDWLLRVTEDGWSENDEWFLYNGKTELDKELGSRISWLSALCEEEPIDIKTMDDYFPGQAQWFDYEGERYWIITYFGQGALSWLMTDEVFRDEYKI